MTWIDLQDNNQHLLLKCVSGSRAYGLALPHSDTDIKGVFVLPQKKFFGLTYTDQLNSETNDVMFYEFKKFMELLLRNNPNLLELLGTPSGYILYKHPLMDSIRPEIFLSRLCKDTFGAYALTQIKKARGLNKKIMKPQEPKRKTILDFCRVISGQAAITLPAWLEANGFQQEHCGLVRVDHMRDVYLVFHNTQVQGTVFKGIQVSEIANEVSLSSVPQGLSPLGVLHFNRDGYSIYCKEFRQYWEWVAVRNEERFENTMNHGKNYDAKNMMHVFRLLNMAEEIARFKTVNVHRPERDFLLRIRAGEFLYEDLLQQAEEKIATVNALFDVSDLPETPNVETIDELLVEIREKFYAS
ncbi:DNA polymerase beta superfamily protein [Chryseolinea lacunae]|uniref:Nucleotidyltransferase domain-containing protein n=1 Tax=Chryseolinea lacunae TaxID=2801331 RepID=A0ABS1KS17_9BACT|nr:nucleotidyltransferase domain-containing protein [Chryseolinea lacunae]MBL0741988.1 nucleotidyltransferase domain-containing protein [Chryseolinea lacunae]